MRYYGRPAALIFVLLSSIIGFPISPAYGMESALGKEIELGGYSMTFTKVWTSPALDQQPYGALRYDSKYRYAVVDFTVKNTGNRAINARWPWKSAQLIDNEGNIYDVLRDAFYANLRVEETSDGYLIFQMLDKNRPQKLVLEGDTPVQLQFRNMRFSTSASGTCFEDRCGRPRAYLVVSGDPYYMAYSIIRFDLSSIPSEAVINSIRLNLQTRDVDKSRIMASDALSLNVLQVPNEFWGGQNLTRELANDIRSRRGKLSLEQSLIENLKLNSWYSFDLVRHHEPRKYLATFGNRYGNLTLSLGSSILDIVWFDSRNVQLDVTYSSSLPVLANPRPVSQAPQQPPAQQQPLPLPAPAPQPAPIDVGPQVPEPVIAPQPISPEIQRPAQQREPDQRAPQFFGLPIGLSIGLTGVVGVIALIAFVALALSRRK